MIHSLRRGHRAAITTVAVVLPIVFGVGLASRQAALLNDSLPVDAAMAASERREGQRVMIGTTEFELAITQVPGGDRAELWIALPAGTSVPRTASESPEVHGPDVLAYWSATAVSGEDAIMDATLLGAFNGARPARFEVPTDPGFLVLYSLAHRTILGSHPLPAPPTGGPGGP